MFVVNNKPNKSTLFAAKHAFCIGQKLNVVVGQHVYGEDECFENLRKFLV